MKNPIAERITDFIKHYHPFSEISYEKLLIVSNSCKVLYLEKNETLFKIHDTIHDSFYVVAAGAVGLSVTSDVDDVLIDKCDEGDIIGLRPFFAKDNYLMTAKAREESILYAIPIEVFKPIAIENTKVLDFLLQSFASNTRNPYDKKHKGKLVSENVIYDDHTNEIQYYQPVNYTTTPITASALDIVKHVAQTMSSKKIGSIIVHENRLPIGIITDKDLRSKIATGLFPIDVTLDKIMSSPVITVPENLSIAEAQMMMLKYNVGHLCVTKDGSNQSENIAITKRLIELAIEKIGTPPPTKFAWLNIGSQGRKEQLLMTDQDNALVFEDVEERYYDATKEYFLNLAKIVTEKLNKIGYEFCPAEMMASNPSWCKSVTDWNNQFKAWINNPGEKGILMATIFFDYDFIYGDENLVNPLTQTIIEELNGNDLFLAYLGSDALKNPPPLGFFRQFLVENDGEHKDTFDVKLRALMPLIDAARILALNIGIKNNSNTSYRFAKLAESEPQNASVYEACNDAFLELLKFRTEEGLKNNSDGRYLNLSELSKLDKVKLKNSFQPISDIQEVIKNRFQLTYFT